jgi:hypothetical protein
MKWNLLKWTLQATKWFYCTVLSEKTYRWMLYSRLSVVTVMLNIVLGPKNIWHTHNIWEIRLYPTSDKWLSLLTFCGSKQGPVITYLILHLLRDVVLLDHPEDECNKLLWNFGTYTCICIMPCPRRLESSSTVNIVTSHAMCVLVPVVNWMALTT